MFRDLTSRSTVAVTANCAQGASGGIPLAVVGRLLEKHKIGASRDPLVLEQLLSSGRSPPQDQLEILTTPSRAGSNLYSHDCARPAVLAHQIIADLTESGQCLPASLHRAAAGHTVTLALHV